MGLRSHSAQNFQSEQFRRRQIESSFIVLRNMSKMMRLAQNPNIERCYKCCGYGHNYKECPNEETIPYEEYLDLKRYWEEESMLESKNGAKDERAKKSVLDSKVEEEEENSENNILSEQTQFEMEQVANIEPNQNCAEITILDYFDGSQCFDHISSVSTPMEVIQVSTEISENPLRHSFLELFENQSATSSKLHQNSQPSAILNSLYSVSYFDDNSLVSNPIELNQNPLESSKNFPQPSCLGNSINQNGMCVKLELNSLTSEDCILDRLNIAHTFDHNFFIFNQNEVIQNALERSKNYLKLLCFKVFENQTLMFSKFRMKLLLFRIFRLKVTSSSSKDSIKALKHREVHIHEDKLASHYFLFYLQDLRTNLLKKGSLMREH